MTVSITTLRATIAADLANISVWSTYSFPPALIPANAVIIVPSDPYLTPQNNSNIGIAPMANFKVIMTVPLLDNQGNLAGIEDMMCAVFAKISNSSIVFNITSASAPSVLSAASGDLLTSEFSISTLTSWS